MDEILFPDRVKLPTIRKGQLPYLHLQEIAKLMKCSTMQEALPYALYEAYKSMFLNDVDYEMTPNVTK